MKVKISSMGNGRHPTIEELSDVIDIDIHDKAKKTLHPADLSYKLFRDLVVVLAEKGIVSMDDLKDRLLDDVFSLEKVEG